MDPQASGSPTPGVPQAPVAPQPVVPINPASAPTAPSIPSNAVAAQPPAMMAAGGMPEGPVFYPANFWQQPWVQNVLPFVTSVSVHLAILIIGLLVFGVYKAVSAPPHQDQVIIPESSMAQEGPPGGVPNVGLGDPLREAAQDKDPSSTDSAWADKKGRS